MKRYEVWMVLAGIESLVFISNDYNFVVNYVYDMNHTSDASSHYYFKVIE